MGRKKPCAATEGTCVPMPEPGREPGSPSLLRSDVYVCLLGGDRIDARLDEMRLHPSWLTAPLVGREGGKAGSPTGPVVEGTLCCAVSNSEVPLEDAVIGRPSFEAGYGSLPRNVGIAESVFCSIAVCVVVLAIAAVYRQMLCHRLP